MAADSPDTSPSAGPALRNAVPRPEPPRISMDTQVFRLGSKEVRLTHLDRVYYPEPGYTKADLLNYYLHVAPYLLPHIRGRPLTLERWPSGITGESFFQKNASAHFPDWLPTFPVQRKDGKKIIRYPLVEDEADLLYLVNQGTLTFHSQMSRVTDPEHPDFMVLDVDPPEIDGPRVTGAGRIDRRRQTRAGRRAQAEGRAQVQERIPAKQGAPAEGDAPGEGRAPEEYPPESDDRSTQFEKAAEVAVLLRGHLQEAGHDPLIKTSGKRGVHLAFPLPPGLDYETARSRLQSFFAGLAERYPELLTIEIRKNKRRGRVYLDALRMSPGATIVPPYVARATAEATVSVPVAWEELDGLHDGRAFTIKNAVARVEKTGDLWEPLITPRQTDGKTDAASRR